MNLFTNQAADGQSAAVMLKNPLSNRSMLYVAGNFGGGTVTLETLAPDKVSWVPVEGVSLTAPGAVPLELTTSVVRLSLTGATTASVSGWIEDDSDATFQAVSARA